MSTGFGGRWPELKRLFEIDQLCDLKQFTKCAAPQYFLWYSDNYYNN